jgi:hypothetical protein
MLRPASKDVGRRSTVGGPTIRKEDPISMSDPTMPETPGGRMGDDMEKMFLDEAKQEHLAKEAKDADADAERERTGLGETVTTKRPWWKFWA